MRCITFGFSYLCIPKTHTNLLTRIHSDLYVETQGFEETQIYQHYHILDESNEQQIVATPKFYPYFIKFPQETIETYYTYGKCEISNQIQFRDEFQEDAYKKLQTIDAGILKAYPGFGKTVVAIKYFTDLNLKALIVVHKEILAQQWKNELLKFTNLNEDEILILFGSSKLKQLTPNTKVIIASIQTLSSLAKKSLLPTENPAFKKILEFSPGITIVDEVHKTIGSNEFSKASMFFVSKKILGLSATPRKQHPKLTNILKYYFDRYIIEPAGSPISITCKIFKFENAIPDKTYKYITYGNKFNYIRYYKMLYKKDSKFEQLFKNTIKALLGRKRNLLILNHLIKNLEIIRNWLLDIGVSKDQIGFLTASIKEYSKPIILSTYQMMTDALSINHLDTLIYSTPFSGNSVTLEQSKGRITRHKNYTNTPLIVDFFDCKYKQIEKLALSRMAEYSRLGIPYEIIEVK